MLDTDRLYNVYRYRLTDKRQSYIPYYSLRVYIYGIKSLF